MKNTKFGKDLKTALAEVRAHRQGKIALPSKIAPALSPERIREIRKSVAKSPAEFESKFGIPARTIEGWEQGVRAPDKTATAYLKVIAADPSAVEQALSR